VGRTRRATLLSVTQEHQRGPELDAKAPPKRMTRPVFNPDVIPLRMVCQRFGKRGLGSSTMAAPAGAKFEQGQAWQGINCGTRRGFDFAEVMFG